MKFDLPALIAGQNATPTHSHSPRSLAAANQSNKPTEPIRKSLSLHKLPKLQAFMTASGLRGPKSHSKIVAEKLNKY